MVTVCFCAVYVIDMFILNRLVNICDWSQLLCLQVLLYLKSYYPHSLIYRTGILKTSDVYIYVLSLCVVTNVVSACIGVFEKLFSLQPNIEETNLTVICIDAFVVDRYNTCIDCLLVC